MMFPPAQRMDTLNDLLAASDLISLHCALTNETIQIINADCLQHIKSGTFQGFFRLVHLFYKEKYWDSYNLHLQGSALIYAGAFLVNTGSNQLLDDCAVK